MGHRPITVSNNPHPTHCTGIELILSIPTLFFLSLSLSPFLPLPFSLSRLQQPQWLRLIRLARCSAPIP